MGNLLYDVGNFPYFMYLEFIYLRKSKCLQSGAHTICDGTITTMEFSTSFCEHEAWTYVINSLNLGVRWILGLYIEVFNTSIFWDFMRFVAKFRFAKQNSQREVMSERKLTDGGRSTSDNESWGTWCLTNGVLFVFFKNMAKVIT